MGLVLARNRAGAGDCGDLCAHGRRGAIGDAAGRRPGPRFAARAATLGGVELRPVENFGHNICFQPAVYLVPADEDEVLQILATHAGRNIRAIGSLHSWSEAAVSDDVLLDLRRLDSVRTERREDEVWAIVGAGCQIKRVLAELERQANATLPSLGLITEQTIAGAISTGTHGSGKASMSHYVEEIRLATYDQQTGQPVVRTLANGDELRAGRCALGCLGVILSVSFRAPLQSLIEEHFRGYAELNDVLAAEEQYPLQQFYLIPWSWRYLAQHRREPQSRRSRLAGLYRAYWFLTIDLGLHLEILFLVRVAAQPVGDEVLLVAGASQIRDSRLAGCR